MIKNVLFLCTGNSARSLIAEGILREKGKGRFASFSAGSQPTGTPNPGAIAILKAKGISVDFARSKSWDEFSCKTGDKPSMDIIITVCSNAAGETCPIWPGHPVSAHWGVEDPADVTGSPQAIATAFGKTYDEMDRRITAFLNLPDVGDEQTSDSALWQEQLAAIGQMDD